MEEEILEVSPPLQPAPPTRPLLPRLLGPVLVLAAGVAVLAVTGLREHRWLAGQPWRAAVLFLDRPEGGASAIGAWVRRLPLDTYPGDAEIIHAMRSAPESAGIVDDFGEYLIERLVMADVDDATLAALTAEGRPPAPGAPEVLAGSLARADSFELDGVEFKVTGRLYPGTGALTFAYLLPRDANWSALFEENAAATHGSIDLGLLDRIDEYTSDTAIPESEREEVYKQASQVHARTRAVYSWAVWLGLGLVAVGGALGQVRLLLAWAPRAPRALRPLLEEMAAWPRLLFGMHALTFGTFFAAKAAGTLMPLWNARVMSVLSAEFSEGGLSYIGDAYTTGNPLHFAAAIFFNNFVVQTFGLTFLVSIPPFALGVLKTLGSFAAVGFAMAPLWTGSAAGYSYHCITMTLEFEPYILACFAVVLWPIRLFRAAATGHWRAETGRAVRDYLSAILLTALLLAIAALYEAVSLILVNG